MTTYPTDPLKQPPQLGHAAIADAPAREILTRATGFIGSYDFTLNPYSGCSFGCTYCYAAFFSRKPEERDGWGAWVRIKSNAVDLLAGRLKRKPGFLDDKTIYMSSVTDPYQPIERKVGLTRGLLKVMAGGSSAGANNANDKNDAKAPQLSLLTVDPQSEEGGPQPGLAGSQAAPSAAPPASVKPRPKLVVQTRSPDVVRDCDLLREIAKNGGRVRVNMTVTTDDEDVRRTFEPYCPSNAARLRAIAEVHAAGVETCITMTPLLHVKDAEGFAIRLLETGVEQFIIQSFHFQKGKFVASTRDQAFDLMAEKLDTDRAGFRDEYLRHYHKVKDTLQERLPALGEDKGGFAPPF